MAGRYIWRRLRGTPTPAFLEKASSLRDAAEMADDGGAPCADERFALMLLDAVARDLKYTRQGLGNEPDAPRAASKLLAMLRKGELGPVCFDEHPPSLERRPQRRKRVEPAHSPERHEARRARRENRAARRIV